MAKKITCPVCFTKMNLVGHDLVCPVCGYKYCEEHIPYTYDDHNHSDYKTYSQKTTYQVNTGNAQPTYQQRASTAQSTYQQRASTAQSTYQQRASTAQAATSQSQAVINQRYAQASQNKQSGKGFRPGRFVFVLFILFIIFRAFSSIFSNMGEVLQEKELWEKLTEYFPDVTTNGSTSNTSSYRDKTSPFGEDAEFVTASEILSYYKSLKEPDSVVQEILCEFCHKKINQITEEDCEKIVGLQLYLDQNPGYAIVFLSDGSYQPYYPTNFFLDTTELRVLTNLEQFRASSDMSLALHPGDLRGLPYLTCLECYNSPAEVLEIIDNPLQIQYLLLADAYMDLTGLDQFGNVYVLWLSSMRFTNEQNIGSLEKLYDLTLKTSTNLNSTDFFDSLDNLESLSIETNHLDDVSFLDILPNLTYLDLHCGEDLTDISAIRYCTELSELILVGAVSLEDPTPIAALQQLDYLTIAECGLTDVSWMTTLQNLSSLDIRNNRITDLSPLSELANLQELHMSGNLVTNYGTIDRSIIVIDD